MSAVVGYSSEEIELARLLARFKLQVRRDLNESVDLGRLRHDAQYARVRLDEIEEAASDEELLVTLLLLRERLVGVPVADLACPPVPEGRKYRFGARG